MKREVFYGLFVLVLIFLLHSRTGKVYVPIFHVTALLTIVMGYVIVIDEIARDK